MGYASGLGGPLDSHSLQRDPLEVSSHDQDFTQQVLAELRVDEDGDHSVVLAGVGVAHVGELVADDEDLVVQAQGPSGRPHHVLDATQEHGVLLDRASPDLQPGRITVELVVDVEARGAALAGQDDLEALALEHPDAVSHLVRDAVLLHPGDGQIDVGHDHSNAGFPVALPIVGSEVQDAGGRVLRWTQVAAVSAGVGPPDEVHDDQDGDEGPEEPLEDGTIHCVSLRGGECPHNCGNLRPKLQA